MPEPSMPSRSSVVWKIEVVTTCVRSPRSSNVGGLDGDVAGHALPLEGLHDALGRRDLAVGPAEAGLAAVRTGHHEAPVAAGADVHHVDGRRHPARTPPFGDERWIGVGRVHAVAGGVEHALAVDLAIARRGDCLLLTGHRGSFVVAVWFARAARRSGRGARRASGGTSAPTRRPRPARRGARLQRRARPTFSVVTSPASSSTPTCFFRPVSEMPNGSASSEIVALPRPRRSRMPRRVGSASAPNVRSIGRY